MMHEQTMQGDSGRGKTNYANDPSPGTGNRADDLQESEAHRFYNEWDGGGAGGWHGAPAARAAQSVRGEAGRHVGKGPKNYRRSDARLTDDIYRTLTDDDVLDASEIEVTVSNGEATLIGTVETRHDRRRAEWLLDDITGLEQIYNQIRVRSTEKQR
jgi:hypothetical protein